MSKEKQTTEIDGFKVVSHQMAPLSLYPLVPRVLKIVSPMLSQMGELMSLKDLGEAGIEKLLKDPKGLLKVQPLFIHLANALGDPVNARLPQELLARTVIHLPNEEGETVKRELGSDSDINKAFRGRFLTMLKCMWFAIGVNFADFFDGDSENAPSKDSGKEEENT